MGNNDRKILEADVTDMLHEIGVPANMKGYRYLRTAVIMAAEDMDILCAVTKELYPAVAAAEGSGAERVERDIRHAIGAAWERGGRTAMEELLGASARRKDRRPSNSEIIAAVANRARLNGRERRCSGPGLS